MTDLSLHPRFRDADPTFTGRDFERAERVRLAREVLLEQHAGDHIESLRWALRKYDLRAVARDAKVDVRTLRAFANGEQTPQASTLRKIERELWDRYDERAEPPCFMEKFFERNGIVPPDLFCGWLIAIDKGIGELERKVLAELAELLDGPWPAHPVTEASLEKSRQRERAARRSSSS